MITDVQNGEIRKAYKILVRKLKGKKPLGKHGQRCSLDLNG
jgi:hypothetical protein